MDATTFSLKDVVTIVIASLGAVLGVLNTWRNINKDRPKLRVTFKLAIPVGGADPRIGYCIEIVNLSSFPLTVSDVGVMYAGSDERRGAISPIVVDGKEWPRRLDPRAAVTVYIQRSAFDQPSFPLECAYAKTDCGMTFTGRSAAFDQVADKVLMRAAEHR